MELLQIRKDNALKAYNAGCPEVKQTLSNLFGPETFVPKKITDRVKTFEDACRELGIHPTIANPPAITNYLQKDARSIWAYCQLIIIARALNEGWVPDWENGKWDKYYPWFDLSSGSGLSCFDCDHLYSYSSVGSRLCFKSRELAEYAAKQFAQLYQEFFIIYPQNNDRD